ncbi:MAG: META domain-containing protein [Burkholderiales bacterium]|nr:META domain-containing protein [Burkholderiales bacterium]
MSTARQAGCAALCAVVLGTAALAASPLDGRWTLTDRRALGGSAGDGGPEVTLEIEGGNVAASAGCNRAAGSIKEQAGRLQIGPLASTMMACPPAVAKIEARYFGVLERGPSWRIDGDRLTLSAAGDTLTFERTPGK